MKKFPLIAMTLIYLILLSSCAHHSESVVIDEPCKPSLSEDEVLSLEDLKTFGNAEFSEDETYSSGGMTFTSALYTFTTSEGQIMLDLRFPQVSGLSDSEKEKTINLMLFDVAIKVLGDGITLSNAQEVFGDVYEHQHDGFCSEDLIANMDYELLFSNNGNISFLFTGEKTVPPQWVYKFEYCVLIDTSTASFCDINDYIPKRKLEKAIKSKQYSVLSGTYTTGWNEYEMADVFLEALEEYQKTEVLDEAHGVISKRRENGRSCQRMKVGQGIYNYQEFDIFSSRNFAYDGIDIFLRFQFDDSLDGYVLLKTPFDLSLLNQSMKD